MLLNILEEVNDRYHWLCHAYCLMSNHYHLVIETPDGNLSIGMRPASNKILPSIKPPDDG